SALLRVLSSALSLSSHETQPTPNSPLQDFCHAPVLLVEDNDINQMIAKEMLQQAGLAVDIAKNGQEAVEMVNAKTYALVFMDIQMPVMDGLTAAEIIRGHFSYQQLPIIRSEEHTSELQSRENLVCRLLLEKKKKTKICQRC